MKTITLLLCLAVSTAFSQSRFRTTALDTAAQQVNLGPTNLINMNVAYPGTTIVYIKIYDSYTKPYAYEQAPVLTIQVGTDATLSYALKQLANMHFNYGCWIRCCTSISDTATKAVEPSTKPLVEITY